MASDWYDRITVAIGVIMLNVMLAVGVLQVLNRYLPIPVPLTWTYEIGQTFLALMTIIGIPYLFKHDSDISFLPVLEQVTNRVDELMLIRNVFMLILGVVLVWSAVVATQIAGDQSLPNLSWFKVGWGFMLFGASAFVLIIMILFDTRDRAKELRGDTDV
jgi:TRAP-type C4-dicarboxylate transport system permease small subunit